LYEFNIEALIVNGEGFPIVGIYSMHDVGTVNFPDALFIEFLGGKEKQDV
jgi:hypothetical protein